MIYHRKGKDLKKKSLRSKKVVSVIVILVLVISPTSLYINSAINKPIKLISANLNTVTFTPKTPLITWPVNVDAALGSVGNGVLAQSSTVEQPRSIASIAKVITALAILAKNPITSTDENIITFTSNDEALYKFYVNSDGSNYPIKAGDQLSEYRALEAMLLPSANNMADSLAIWAFGSIDNYSTYANEMVKSFGLKTTSVGEASGFNDTVLSTPADLIVLGQKLLQNPYLAQIVKLKSDNIPGYGKIYNTNQLLDGQVSGIKTGHTNTAGYCLLLEKTFSIDAKHSINVISAILGAQTSADSFSLSNELMNSALNNLGNVVVVVKNTVVGTYKTPWGSQSDIITSKDLSVYGWESLARKIQIDAIDLNLPTDTATKVGSISTNDDNGLVEYSDLVLKTDIKSPSPWWRLIHYF